MSTAIPRTDSKRDGRRFLLSVLVHGKKNLGVGLLMKLIQDAG